MVLRTHFGHYEFLVIPFGLTNVTIIFQSVMNKLFRPYLRKFVLVFFDDILVYSTTWTEHLQQVNTVLGRLQQQQWVANKKKSKFGKTSIRYLGHVITGKGVEMDKEKLEVVVVWEEPKTLKAEGIFGIDRVLSEVCKRLWQDSETSNRDVEEGQLCMDRGCQEGDGKIQGRGDDNLSTSVT